MSGESLVVDTSGNRAVDETVLQRVEEVNQRLRKLGVSPKTGYSIEPALGGRFTPAPRHLTKRTNVQPQIATEFVPHPHSRQVG